MIPVSPETPQGPASKASLTNRNNGIIPGFHNSAPHNHDVHGLGGRAWRDSMGFKTLMHLYAIRAWWTIPAQGRTRACQRT
jgi:hypothetical protein